MFRIEIVKINWHIQWSTNVKKKKFNSFLLRKNTTFTEFPIWSLQIEFNNLISFGKNVQFLCNATHNNVYCIKKYSFPNCQLSVVFAALLWSMLYLLLLDFCVLKTVVTLFANVFLFDWLHWHFEWIFFVFDNTHKGNNEKKNMIETSCTILGPLKYKYIKYSIWA